MKQTKQITSSRHLVGVKRYLPNRLPKPSDAAVIAFYLTNYYTRRAIWGEYVDFSVELVFN